MEHLVVITEGVIELEMGSAWSCLITKIIAVKFLDRILASVDHVVANTFRKIIKKQGFKSINNSE